MLPCVGPPLTPSISLSCYPVLDTRQDIEAALVKADIDRQARTGKADAPAAARKASELNDPSMMRRRGKLMLPAPQVRSLGAGRRASPVSNIGCLLHAHACPGVIWSTMC